MTNADGRYRFMYDTKGNPIVNADYGTGSKDLGTKPDFYLRLLGRNEYAYVVREDTLSTTRLEGDLAVKIVDKSWFQNILWNDYWGEYWFDVSWEKEPSGPVGEYTAETLKIDAVVNGTVDTAKPANQQSELAPIEWIRHAALQAEKTLGISPPPAVPIVHPSETGILGPKPSQFGACFTPSGVIVLGAREVVKPGSILHEYGHAIQGYSAGTPDYPYPLSFINDEYGMVAISGYRSTAFAEAWASFYAAKTLEPIYHRVWPVLDGIDRNRGYTPFLENNDYWRGYSAYGIIHNSTAEGGEDEPGRMQLPERYLSNGVHDTRHMGHRSMGAIMSIFWDLSDGKGDDPLDDARGMVKALKTSASEGTLQAFISEYRKTAVNVRAFNTVLVDHGVPVGDDAMETNHYPYNNTSNVPFRLSGKLPLWYAELYMEETERGHADWYELYLPASAAPTDPAKKYGIAVSIGFDIGYGDLDLFVDVANLTDGHRHYMNESARRGTGRAADDRTYQMTGGYPSQPTLESVPVLNLDWRESYRILIGVSGRGALKLGQPNQCGDMHPNYSLAISARIPEPPKSDNV